MVQLTRRGLSRGALAVLTAAGLGVALDAGQGAAAQAASTSSGPDHVFVIMMENHGYNEIIGDTTDAPYINSLAQRYNVETNYHGVTHPSLPNYLAAVTGSFQGIWDDCKAGAAEMCAPEEFVPNSGDSTSSASLTTDEYNTAAATPHMFSAQNIVDQVESSGRTWRAYMQSMPSAGYEGEYYPGVVNGTLVKLYAQKHNPFMYLSDINSAGNPRLNDVVPFDSFGSDLASGNVPNFVWISPDQCHDMHGISSAAAAIVNEPACANDPGAIQLGDQFLQQTVSQIMASNTWQTTKSSIVIMWDENDYCGYSGGPGCPVGADNVVLGGGDAPLLVINSAAGPHKTSDKLADHYTVLSTIEHMWHLGCLANTCSPTTSGTLEELFRP
jgi:hypothetical protein